jgi:nuclear GTP-binding protein
LDLTGASRIVLRDWSTGKFPWYTTPSVNPSVTAVELFDNKRADLYANDGSILATLKTRKEMRKGGGLVRLIAGEIESRKVAIEEPWSHVKEDESDDDGDGDDEDGMDMDEDGEEVEDDGIDDSGEDDDDDEDEDEDEDEDADDEPSPPISSKRKRKRAAEISSVLPSKKVAFALDPKGSKQSRAAGSRKGQTQEKPIPKSKAPVSKSVTPKVKPPKALAAVVEKKQKGTNIATKATPRRATSGVTTGDGGDDEAYDFGKFF